MLQFFKNIYSYRELLWALSLRELRIRYKQTLLGVAWAVIQPLAMMFVFTLVFSKLRMVTIDDTGGFPYPIFSYCALVPWTFFSVTLTFATRSIQTNMNLLMKIYFPREIFPLAKIMGGLINYLIAMGVFLLMMIYYSISIHPTILIFPLIFLTQLFLMIGLSLILSAINVSFRDIGHAVQLSMFLWLFATPVSYPISKVPESFLPWYRLNPMVGIIDSYRKVILEGEMPDMNIFGISIIGAVIVFIIGNIYFKRSEKRFADII